MSLLKRILREKRLVIMSVVVVLVVDAGLFALGVYPRTVRMASARQRTAAAAQALVGRTGATPGRANRYGWKDPGRRGASNVL